MKVNNLPDVSTFIDFRKDFDTTNIHFSKMLKILHAYGIPRQITEAVENIYNNTVAKVISPDGAVWDSGWNTTR